MNALRRIRDFAHDLRDRDEHEGAYADWSPTEELARVAAVPGWDEATQLRIELDRIEADFHDGLERVGVRALMRLVGEKYEAREMSAVRELMCV
jgi:hypothetical protein